MMFIKNRPSKTLLNVSLLKSSSLHLKLLPSLNQPLLKLQKWLRSLKWQVVSNHCIIKAKQPLGNKILITEAISKILIVQWKFNLNIQRKSNLISLKVVGSAASAKTTTSKEEKSATDARRPKTLMISMESLNICSYQNMKRLLSKLKRLIKGFLKIDQVIPMTVWRKKYWIQNRPVRCSTTFPIWMQPKETHCRSNSPSKVPLRSTTRKELETGHARGVSTTTSLSEMSAICAI